MNQVIRVSHQDSLQSLSSFQLQSICLSACTQYRLSVHSTAFIAVTTTVPSKGEQVSWVKVDLYRGVLKVKGLWFEILSRALHAKVISCSVCELSQDGGTVGSNEERKIHHQFHILS